MQDVMLFFSVLPLSFRKVWSYSLCKFPAESLQVVGLCLQSYPRSLGIIELLKEALTNEVALKEFAQGIGNSWGRIGQHIFWILFWHELCLFVYILFYHFLTSKVMMKPDLLVYLRDGCLLHQPIAIETMAIVGHTMIQNDSRKL